MYSLFIWSWCSKHLRLRLLGGGTSAGGGATAGGSPRWPRPGRPRLRSEHWSPGSSAGRSLQRLVGGKMNKSRRLKVTCFWRDELSFLFSFSFFQKEKVEPSFLYLLSSVTDDIYNLFFLHCVTELTELGVVDRSLIWKMIFQSVYQSHFYRYFNLHCGFTDLSKY